ncbi:hypothetical protein [Polaribacter ponticola]|uniref:Uncharacterized protein n=1 Tax=Polaribacter ponticola TaxID=2978475 RepID=A0ABT5S9A6_9FLAO|nr:hypothetical protein [Polaribacter sp. MSW5]MDD7914691.1 hypothetical protein [Polaribacter sp. MSW5]
MTVNYANNLSSCFSKDEVKFLNEGVSVFENELKEFYSDEKLTINELYKKYLKDFVEPLNSQIKLHSKASLSFIKELKQSKVFESIYINLYDLNKNYEERIGEGENEEVVLLINNDSIMSDEQLKSSYIFYPYEDFFQCIKSQNESKKFNQYIEALESVCNASPRTKVTALNFSQLENLEFVKLYVAYDFYFQSILNNEQKR